MCMRNYIYHISLALFLSFYILNYDDIVYSDGNMTFSLGSLFIQ